MFGVTTMTVNGWEIGRKAPKVSYVPRIIDFIGYDPFALDELGFGERLRAARWKLGLTQVKLARMIGVTQNAISLVEIGEVESQEVPPVIRGFIKKAEGGE